MVSQKRTLCQKIHLLYKCEIVIWGFSCRDQLLALDFTQQKDVACALALALALAGMEKYQLQTESWPSASMLCSGLEWTRGSKRSVGSFCRTAWRLVWREALEHEDARGRALLGVEAAGWIDDGLSGSFLHKHLFLSFVQPSTAMPL